jgi:ankyrin repeat protein
MWIGSKCESSSAGQEALFNELTREVKTAAPCSQLTYRLRNQLERCDLTVRSELASRVSEGCSPLFTACKKGNVEIVEYLLSVCNADVEVKGLYEVQDDRTIHTVTPLWCAAVAGKLKVVEVLVKFGADVNSVSDTGSTPVRSACFMTHLDIVRLLVENGADIQKPNQNGGTCLINSVQSVELCEFLLKNGAFVNAQDVQNKTALHYAIQEHRFETTKLLLRYGADPFLESRYRDDALQTACLKGASEIFKWLVDHVPYRPERVASAFELLGSTFLDEHHDLQKTLQYWKAACDVRDKFGIVKPILPAKPQYRHMKEFTTKPELEPLALDLDAIRMQSLLICERCLGTMHKDMIYRLMYRGAAYADSLQYQHCIDLWKYALELRVAKDSILFCDTSFTAQALVKLYLDLYEKHAEGILNTSVQLEDVVSTIELLVSDLQECSRLLKIKPQFEKQQKAYDQVLQIITHLLHLVTCLHSNEDEDYITEIRRRIHTVVRVVDPRTTAGDSLLHLSVMKNNTLKTQHTQNMFEEGKFAFFPSVEVAKLLVECGAKINAYNHNANSPLHTASNTMNYRQEIVETLLEHGAHIDARNSHGLRPLDMLKLNPDCKINPLQYLTLRCLAANVIVGNGLPYKPGQVPTVLEEFIEAH